MKKILVILFLFVGVTASAQDIPDDDTTSKPAITPIGKPDGAKAEMKIGKDGGSLTSADRKVKLIIPEGAVSKKTTFSIQPMTNLMPNGNGLAYRLEPSGIQFQKPVQIVFHYDPEKSEDSSELFMGIAMQDEKGQWYSLNKFTLDTVAKTINGNINHFSTWATYDWLALRADAERLKVKKSQVLVIKGVFADPEHAKFYSEELSSLRSWKPPHTTIWRVNGIIKGNPEVGTLRRGKAEVSWGHWNGYWAPDNVPDQNPVTISVDLVGASFVIRDQTFGNLKLKAKILIYDNAYEITMVSSIEHPAGDDLGTVTYKDSGSFVVSLNGKDTKIIEKVNNESDALVYQGKCVITLKKIGTGNIHVAGVKSMKVIKSKSPGEPAEIEIFFQHTPTIFPLLEFSCPNRKGEPIIFNNDQGNAMFIMVPAYPQYIKFFAIGGEQIEHIGQEGSAAFVKYTVKQIKDE